MNYLKRLFTQWQEKRKQKTNIQAQQEAFMLIQLMEYKNETYISYKGIPLIRADEVVDLHKTLKDARQTRIDFLNEFN
jgi:hypothetical protein|nr:MAG TPA: hypothetical protein [Caudoviricetes sp.]